jgi:hypothetical protein
MVLMVARAHWLALLLLLAPIQAGASTLTFVGIEPFFDELTARPPGPPDGWSGTYVEGHYAVDVFANAAGREVRDGQLGIHDGSPGAGTLFSDVVIRRTDGKSFILGAFRISEVMSNYFGLYNYEPAAAEQLNLEQALALQWPNLELIGTKTDGSTVSARISAWRASADNEGTVVTGVPAAEIRRGVWTSDPTSPYFTSDLAMEFTASDYGPGFRSLRDLRVNFVPPRSADALVCARESVSRLDPVFAPLSSCASPIVLPDGSRIDSMFMFGPRNDSGYVFIDSMTLPVPLPPAGLLIIGAFGALIGLRRWRR